MWLLPWGHQNVMNTGFNLKWTIWQQIEINNLTSNRNKQSDLGMNNLISIRNELSDFNYLWSPFKNIWKKIVYLQLEMDIWFLDSITVVVKGLDGRVVTIVGFLPKVYPRTRFSLSRSLHLPRLSSSYNSGSRDIAEKWLKMMINPTLI